MYPKTYDKIIYKLCEKHQINIQKIEGESIYRLSKNNTVHFIWSRRFDINSALSCRLADNKYSTYLLLNALSIPTVMCVKLPRIDTEDYSYLEFSIFEICQKLLSEFDKIIIKPNNSYEGTDVYLCENLKDVEKTLFQIESKYKYLITSPYINAKSEYRLFFLDNHILYGYKKVRKCIICDGFSSVAELLLKNKINSANMVQEIFHQYDKIYPKGYQLQINWKFNLSQGAACIAIDDTSLYNRLSNIAISAANAINIRFATVDIIEDIYGNLQILEINAGVAMDQFITKYPNGQEIATTIYEKALIAMFNINENDLNKSS